MTQIIVTPEQLREFGVKFNTSSDQVQELLNQVQNLVNTLQGGAWKGNRANKFYGDWGGMKPQVDKAISTLREASQLLKAAGDAFEQVDSSR